MFFCLLELAAKGAYGIIEDVYILGCPVMATKKNWEQISSIVAGRVVNGFNSNDTLLGVLYRASHASWSQVAGLNPVEGVEGIENVDLKDILQSHMEYRAFLPSILKRCGFNITHDFFEDIEDEEEQDRLEAEQEKLKINERKLREKEEKLKKKQLENEWKISQKTGVEKKKSGWFTRSSKESVSQSASNNSLSSSKDLWQPKELASTLPPLVISSSKTSTPISPNIDERLEEAGLSSLIAFGSVDSSLDQFLGSPGKDHHKGAGDLIDLKTDFEYISDSEDGRTSARHQSPTPMGMDLTLPSPSASKPRDRIRSLTGIVSPINTFPADHHHRSSSENLGYIEKNPWES